MSLLLILYVLVSPSITNITQNVFHGRLQVHSIIGAGFGEVAGQVLISSSLSGNNASSELLGQVVSWSNNEIKILAQGMTKNGFVEVITYQGERRNYSMASAIEGSFNTCK